MSYAVLQSLLRRVRALARVAIKFAIAVFAAQAVLTFAAALASQSALSSLPAYGGPALRLILAVVALRVVTRGIDAALARVALAHKRAR